MSWEKVKLSECCISISDGDHQPPPKASEGVPFVTISNINSENQFDFKSVMYAPIEYYEKLDFKRKAQKNDILYSVVGSFGIPVFVKNDNPIVFQRHIAILRPDIKVIEPRFLYYTMLSRDFYAQADTVALGAAQRTISLTALRNMEIYMPSLGWQKKIVKILGSYDDLIENSKKQINLLEEMAQRLYKEWFVDLRFPGYEDVKIVNGVPEGWSKDNIGALIGKVTRTKQIKVTDYKREGKIPIIDQSKEFIAGYTDDVETLISVSEPIIVFGDHTRILKLIQFSFAKGADGTQLIVSNCDRMPQRLLYCSLINIDLSNYHYARHFKYLKAEEVMVPTVEIAEKFETILVDVFKQVQNCRYRMEQAVEARNKLLSRLICGELEV